MSKSSDKPTTTNKDKSGAVWTFISEDEVTIDEEKPKSLTWSTRVTLKFENKCKETFKLIWIDY